ncbi:hypothetical protein [Streptomyces sp. YIM 130001]|uniref:hypothetical protein n=1 Tax=Streptomyces sp. YIM 130001 TaxID=2259644 RepID=UPI0013C4050B|nr:hypothetical protein [Streptomyces sp. YIM 130001]
MATSTALTERLYAIRAGTPDEEIAALIDDPAAHLEPLPTRLTGPAPLDEQAAALVNQLGEQTLRPVQHHVLRQVQEHLVRPDET